MRPLLEHLIGSFHERPLPALTKRDARLPALTGKIDVVIGMRRSGKSWRLYQAMQELLEAGLPKTRLLYLNFDDERLHPIEASDLRLIPEVYYRLYPEHKSERCHFFFDEIQNVPGWERFVRRLLDTENVQLTLTGSSATLLSREIAGALRGRGLAAELFPFSFAEMLRHEGRDPHLPSAVGDRLRAMLSNRLRDYLVSGGFPEVQGLEAPLRVRILQEYVDVVILRDVVERHNVGNLPPLRRLIRTLLSSPATPFSVNRFHNDLKSQGIASGKNTLHDHLAHLTDAYLVESVSIDSRSERQKQVNPRKIYPIDPGLAQDFRHAPGIDRGRLLETLVYLDLRRRDAKVTYLRTDDGYEVDFLARSDEAEVLPIQVTESLADPAVRERELRALRAALEERNLPRGVIVTLDEEDQVDAGTRRVDVIPAWRWLLRDGGMVH